MPRPASVGSLSEQRTARPRPESGPGAPAAGQRPVRPRWHLVEVGDLGARYDHTATAAGEQIDLVALRGPLLFFLLPPTILVPLGRLRVLRRLLRALLRPLVSFTAWIAVVAAWHLPQAYGYALRHQWAHDLEHASFVVAGTLAWIQVVDPTRRAHLTRGGRALFAFGMLVFGSAIVDGLLFSRAPAYGVYAAQPHRVFGLSALLDQRLAGLVMFAEQALTVGAALVLLLRPHLRAVPTDAPSTLAAPCQSPPRRRRSWASASSAAGRSRLFSPRSAR